MVQAEDALELLLPGTEEPVLRCARRIVHFLRLFSDDGHPTRAAAVAVDLDRARFELERQDRRRLELALCDLLRHHLSAVAGAESFAWFGEASLGVQEAWRVLEGFREDIEWLAGVPE